MATSGEKDRREGERKAKEAAEVKPAGPEGYAEPRPEQKQGEGEDLGQKQADTLNEADWNQREGSEAAGGKS